MVNTADIQKDLLQVLHDQTECKLGAGRFLMVYSEYKNHNKKTPTNIFKLVFF